MMRPVVRFLVSAAILLPACSLFQPGQGLRLPLPRADWGTHHNPLGFTIQYPTTWKRLDTGEYPMVWSLEVPPGTNLLEKRMEIDILEHATDCRQSTYGAESPDESSVPVVINGAEFLRQQGAGIAAGNIYEWTSYSRLIDTSCLTITFVLHSSSSGVYATEPAPFDEQAESAIFRELIQTFHLVK